ncbi:hypothetical protein QJS04_geneDACA010402 [Acorus gramineus]|uniref:VQ domain-containing protein n=1 Tax=Acorus gramineus TaxID=55184 RepID=A0AAV9A628_ACOGR|nr:hypothetical protein QJS04_geneDACA010402 [Acorus gramineus]
MEHTPRRSAAMRGGGGHGDDGGGSGSFKPKIRIIHVFTPEIIKTDAANFRDLVQRLTGKPTSGTGVGGRRKRKRCKGGGSAARTVSEEETVPPPVAVVKEEELVVEEGTHNTNGYLNMLGDLNFDVFMHGLSELPLVPALSCSSYLDAFGEAHHIS